jgi:hypothetical protein
VHKSYEKTHEALHELTVQVAEQNVTQQMVIDEVREDRKERREDMDKLFSKVNAVDKGLESKADKDKVITPRGATIFIGAVGLLCTMGALAWTVFG